jgi:hypothetical protein
MVSLSNHAVSAVSAVNVGFFTRCSAECDSREGARRLQPSVTVTFNGTSATPTAWSDTSITAPVPPGATNGPVVVTVSGNPSLNNPTYTVGVTTPGDSATRDAFLVTATSGAPTISGFSPAIAMAGTALTVNGTNFEPIPNNNNLSLNIVQATVTAATSTTLSTSVPAVGSGRLSLATPRGQAVSSQDVFVPFGTYVAGDVGFTAGSCLAARKRSR